jgi:protein-S-isoprenylcysteine O-methyltransferase Ste14
MPEPKDSSAPAETGAGPGADVRPGTGARPGADPQTMLPHRRKRRTIVESVFVRIIATCGVVAIGVAIAAIMDSSGSKGWLIGLVVSIVSVMLAAVLWSSRRL